MLEPARLEKIKDAIWQMDRAEYDALKPAEKRKVHEFVAANRAIAKFRTYETKVMTPDIDTAVEKNSRK